MATDLAKAKKKATKRPTPAKSAKVHRFWIRPSNPELDRTGQYILDNLDRIRSEAVSRGDAP